MSLISAKNFVAPFTNRVHLITILLVSVLFATFRLSGGLLESRGANDSSRLRRESPSAPIMLDRTSSNDLLFDDEAVPARGNPERSAGEKPNAAPIDGDVLKDLMASNAAKRQEPGSLRAPDKEGSEKPSNSGLDDIERRLGMR